MQTGLQRRNAKTRVLIMRRGNQQGINRATGNHLLARTENLYALFLVFLQLMRRGAAHGGQFAARHFTIQKIVRMEAPHVAHADNANAYLVHDDPCEIGARTIRGEGPIINYQLSELNNVAPLGLDNWPSKTTLAP